MCQWVMTIPCVLRGHDQTIHTTQPEHGPSEGGEEGKDLLPHDQLDADIHGFAVLHAPGIQALRGHTRGPQRVRVAKVAMEKKLHLK